MNKYRREVSIEILVGLFMFTVLITLGVFTIVLSSEKIWKESYQYEFVFSEISGLREGDNVYVRGLNVGRVKQTDLEEGHVRVYVTLDAPLYLRQGYIIDVVDSSMLGGKKLKIYEGPDGAPELGESMTILGAKPVDMIEELARVIGGFQAVIDAVNSGKGTLGKLLKDETIHKNMATISEDLMRIMDRIESGEGSLGQLLVADDGQLYADGKIFMANLRIISQNLADGKGTLGKMMFSSVDDNSYDDLQTTLANIRSITQSINEGEGTLGRLVRDAKLYDETTLLIEDVRAAVDDLREASPITSFGSVLFGAF